MLKNKNKKSFNGIDPEKKRKIDEIKSLALKENKTSNLAEEKKKIKQLISKIKKLLSKNNIDATITLGGSSAKGTFIGDDFDIDIFIRFKYEKYINKDISSILKKALQPLSPSIVHGSRDYFQIYERYEVIPVLNIKSYKDVVNVTDASPLHASWVKKNLTGKSGLKDGIKLAKLFFKSAGVYGAESYIKGFSGHVTDILMIYYGSFDKLIVAISKWRKNVEVDIEGHKGVLDKSKVQGAVIVVDPIQPNRNAAAAVSKGSFETIKKYARDFLKKPDISFFRVKKFDFDKAKKRYNLILKVNVPEGKTNIVGASLMKAYEHFFNRLHDFDVKESGWYWDKKDKCYFYFRTKKEMLEPYKEVKGPSKDFPCHVKRFKQKYKNAKMVSGVAYAKVKRRVRDLKTYSEKIISDEKIKEKTKGVKIV